MNKKNLLCTALLVATGIWWSAAPRLDVLRAEAAAPSDVHAEVVVYGGTPSGVMAAVAAARHGHTVALVDLNNHVGGVVSSGLCDSDNNDRKIIGGLAKEFFDRIVKYYTDTYDADSEQAKRAVYGVKFEPHIAEKVFNDLIAEQAPRITVYKACRYKSATVADGKVTSLAVDSLNDKSVRTFTGDIFIDASYEGDLMAGAKVPYTYGREGRDQYGESLAGVGDGPDKGKGDKLMQAYNYRFSITSDTANRVLFPKPAQYDPAPWAKIYALRLQKGTVTDFGHLIWSSDTKIGPNQKYDMNSDDLLGGANGYPDGDWATRDQIANRIRDYILSKLYYLQNDPALPQAWRDNAQKWGLPKDEFTDNGNIPFQLYVREARRMIGAYVLTQNDLMVDRYKTDGICAGSYPTDCHTVQFLTINGKQVQDHTHHLYGNDYDIPYGCIIPKDTPGNLLVPVRCSTSHVAYCSLRMEFDFMQLGHAAGDAAHLALANKTTVQKVDVQELRKLLAQEGAILDAGYLPPVKITFTPAHPKPGDSVHFHAESDGLKNPLTNLWWDFEGTGETGGQGADADHSFKLEKVYHVSLVVEDQAGLRHIVFADVPVGAAADRDVTIDDLDADYDGRFDSERPILEASGLKRYSDVFIGSGISHDMDIRGKTEKFLARFQPHLSAAGRYLVCLGYRPSVHQASNAAVTISADGKATPQVINEKAKDSPFPLVSLGEFHCSAGNNSFVEVGNDAADGRVVVDAVRWVWIGD